jgi:basic amino acid/polyamine antiporter, APA family
MNKPSHPELLRTLTSWEAAAIVVGTVIGSGIFLVPSAMAQKVGGAPMVLAVFVFGGLLSLAGALTYAELGAALPHAGGEYVYLREAYGPFWSFLYGWTQFWVAKSGSIAALATAFAYYLANFWPRLEERVLTIPIPLGDGGGPLPVDWGQIVAMALIVVLGAVNYVGVKTGGRVQTWVTGLKIVLILAIVGLAALLGGGSAANFSSTTAHQGGVVGFFGALVAALWAYDGWNNVNMASGEVRDPHRNIPRALIGGVLAVASIYVLANLAYFSVLSADEIAASKRVAADAARGFLGDAGGDAVSFAAMISIFAALNGSILSGARVPYAMARDGYFVRSMAAVHPRFRTPHVAIVGLTTWAAILVLSGRYDQLFTYVIFASWILYAMTAATVFVLRRKRPDLERPYRALGYPWIPAAFVLIASALVGMTLVESPRESLLGLALIAAGVPFFIRYRKKVLAIGEKDA